MVPLACLRFCSSNFRRIRASFVPEKIAKLRTLPTSGPENPRWDGFTRDGRLPESVEGVRRWKDLCAEFGDGRITLGCCRRARRERGAAEAATEERRRDHILVRCFSSPILFFFSFSLVFRGCSSDRWMDEWTDGRTNEWMQGTDHGTEDLKVRRSSPHSSSSPIHPSIHPPTHGIL